MPLKEKANWLNHLQAQISFLSMEQLLLVCQSGFIHTNLTSSQL